MNEYKGILSTGADQKSPLRFKNKVGLTLKKRFNIIVSVALEREVKARAFKIALVAGTIYNLINQGDKLFGHASGQLDLLKLCLTYITPYAVSTYTAVSIRLTNLRKIPTVPQTVVIRSGD